MLGRISAITKSLLGTALVVALSTAAAAQGNKPLQNVTMISGNPLMIQATYELYVPLAMGWWKDEGYNVTISYSPGSGAGAQSVIGGTGPVGLINTVPWLAGNAKGMSDIRSVAIVANTVWRVVTLKSSGLTKVEDLRGKTIGLAVPGTGGAMYLNTLLAKHGIAPNEVKQVVIGMGAQAFQALSSGTVQAFLDFTPDIVQFQVLGGDVNFIYDEAWLRFPDFGMVATAKALKEDPKMVEAIARGVVKAMIFAKANPECVAKIFRKDYAKQRQTTVEQDAKMIEGQLPDRDIPFAQTGSRLRGVADLAGLTELQDFLIQNNVITTRIPSEKLIPDDPDFYKKINDFDLKAVQDQARQCPGY
jgi:NitT/TauT family transport system substrate-binding protein